jgi:hypothetical protein
MALRCGADNCGSRARSVAMLAMHFGHPDPDMRSHDATASGAAIRPASAATPPVAGRHGSHSDSHEAFSVRML